MPLYENNCNYKLVHKEDYDNLNIYIGSTTNFKRRKSAHKNACNNKTNNRHNSPVYQFIRNNGGWTMWDMIEIEKYPCEDQHKAFKREREVIDRYKATLNSLNPYTSIDEKRTKTNKYLKESRQINPEKWSDRDYKNYHKYKDITSVKRKTEMITCECGSIVRKVGIYAHKKSKKHIDFICETTTS